MKGKALKKILAASLVLTLMSGAVPMTPFAQSFGVITANAKDDYELPFIPAHTGYYKFYVTNNTDFVTVTWHGEAVTSSTQQLDDRYSVIMSADKPFTWTVGNSTNTAAQNSSGKYVVNLGATSDVTINPYYASVAHDTGYARESNIYLKPENFAEGEYFYYDKSIPTGTLRASKSENTVSFSTVLDTPVAMYDELGNQITLTQNGSVYSFEPVESETYYLIRTHIAGTEGNWDGNETGFIPVSPLPTPVVKHDNGSGIEEDVELTRANFDESGSMFMTDKSFADGEIINLQADPSTLQGLLMVKPGTSVSVYRAIYGNSIQLTKLENSDSTSDNYTFPIMEVESYYIVKDYQEVPCIQISDDALTKITSVKKDDEDVELSGEIPVESGYYTFTSSYPLVFEGAYEEKSDYTVTASGNEYNYWFDLDGTQTLSVTLADLPAVTFEQQLLNENKLRGFKYFGSSVDYNTYSDLLDGEYSIASTVPLEFVKTGENGSELILTNHYYTSGLYEYHFSLNYSTSPTADFEIREAASSDLPLVPFTVTGYAQKKINVVNMIVDENTGMSAYVPSFDPDPPQYLQAGSYEIFTKDKLFISGAQIVSTTFEASASAWRYEIIVPESSTSVVLDIKDICRCDKTFYDADNNELDLDALSYTGERLVPASVKIVDRGYELVEGVDYEIVYYGEWIQPSDDDEEIYPIVSVSGLGDYAGTGTEFHGYINIESFSVTLPENMEIVNGVTLTDGMAYYGTEIKFRVNDGYTASNVSDGTNALTPDENGIYTVVVKGDLTVSADIEEIPLENNSTVSAEEIVFGDSITVTADAEGGAGGFTYAVYFKKDYSSDWTVKQDFDENTEVTIKPAKATAYSVLVIAKDSRGKTSEKTFNIDVRGKLTNTSSLEKDEIYFGNDIVVNASAEGGMGDRTFAVYYKKTASDKWITAQNFSDNTSVSITPAAATTYNVVVKVKDSRGVVSRKAFTVTVNGMENTSTVTVDTGSDSDRINNIKVSCSTKGSIGDVQYAVYYKKTASDNWMIAQRFSDNTELTITPAVPTDYDVMIRARDIRGVVSKKIITVNTSKKQETSTIVIED